MGDLCVQLKSFHFVLPPLLHAECWTVVFGDSMQWVVVGGAWSGGHCLERNSNENEWLLQ